MIFFKNIVVGGISTAGLILSISSIIALVLILKHAKKNSNGYWAQQKRFTSVTIDLIIAYNIFCIALGIASLYVHWVRSTGSGEFYIALDGLPNTETLLWPLFRSGAFFGTVNVLFYGIFRLGMGRSLSVLFTSALITSPFQLYILASSLIRDYYKAPYILAIIFLMGLLVILPLKRWTLYAICIAAGGILGHGLGIRQDIVILILPFIFVLCFLLPGKTLGNPKWKGWALLLLFLLFYITKPNAMEREVNSAPIRVLAGFMSPYNTRLNVTHTRYDWGYLFLDEFVETNTYFQALARTPEPNHSYRFDEFYPIGLRHIFTLASIFPGDIVTRTYASILTILELPFSYSVLPVGVDHAWIKSFYRIRGVVINLLSGWGVFICGLTLLLISSRNISKGLLLLLFLVYFSGYPAIQFQGRHYFHLEFISWLTLGSLIQYNPSRVFTCPRGISIPEKCVSPIKGISGLFSCGIETVGKKNFALFSSVWERSN